MNRDRRAFYLGRMGTARLFAQGVLPLLTAESAIANRVETILMSVPDEAW